jgi:glucokinase
LEAYAGGWAIAERAQEAVRSDTRAGEPLIELAGSVGQISAATVTKAYANGDPLAKYIVEETVRYLAAGLVGIVNAFNPCLLVLGGGVIQGLPDYISMAEHIVRLNALEAAVKDLHIVTAALGNKAGVIGAAALARHEFQKVE